MRKSKSRFCRSVVQGSSEVILVPHLVQGRRHKVWARMAGVGRYVLIGYVSGLNTILASRALTFFLRPSTACKETLKCTRIPEWLKGRGGWQRQKTQTGTLGLFWMSVGRHLSSGLGLRVTYRGHYILDIDTGATFGC